MTSRSSPPNSASRRTSPSTKKSSPPRPREKVQQEVFALAARVPARRQGHREVRPTEHVSGKRGCMRRNRILLVAAGLFGLALIALCRPSLAEPAGKDRPGGKEAGASLPERYKDLAKTARTRLLAVWGAPEQEPAFSHTVAFSADHKLALTASGS